MIAIQRAGRFLRRLSRHPVVRAGFTFIEMLIALAIVGTLSAMGIPVFHEALEAARVTQAIGDIDALQTEIATYEAGSANALPLTLADVGWGDLLDPWGEPYVYVNFPATLGSQFGKGKGKGGGIAGIARKDRFLVPLNTTYDLYSMGADGETVRPLTAKVSKDDVIRANDGSFIGLAEKY